MDTSFLPDKDREREIEEKKKKLLDEMHERQEMIKGKTSENETNRLEELLETKFCYWDGLNNLKTLTVEYSNVFDLLG